MKFFLLVFLLSVIGFVGCKSETQFGQCVGFDNDDHKPNLVYKISIRNAIVSIIFAQTIIVPVIWAFDYAYCPVEKK